MRKNFGHLAFDGREYTDAPDYPVDRQWAERLYASNDYGYHHNASFRTAIMGQASDRNYFNPPGGGPTWQVKDVNIPLQAYGDDAAAPPAGAGGQYDKLWQVGGQLLGTVGVAWFQNRAANQQAEMANQTAIEQAKWNAMAASNQPATQSGGGGSTLAIVGVLGIVGLGAAYFLFKDSGAEEAE
jgi:hypothetical protein